MSAAYRTPDENFEGLPGWPYEPSYREWQGMRLAHYDVGPADGPVVMLFHGEPTWSFLYRKVMGPLLAAGYRCVLQDQPGFGRSDKPTDLAWYTYDRQTEAARDLAEQLSISDATFVVQDWGGPIGLRLAMERPGTASRLAILDTGLFTGEQRMSDAWIAFRDFVQRTEDLPIDMLIRNACAIDHGEDVWRAYTAPFPVPESKAGARSFPLMLPTSPEMEGAAAGRATLESLRESDLPMIVLWADRDPVLTLDVGERFAAAIGAPAPEVIENASHFLQEDQGQLIGERIVTWLAEQRD